MLFFIFMLLHNVNIESLQGAFFSKLCTMTSHQFWFKSWSLVDQRGNSFHKNILKWKNIWAFVLKYLASILLFSISFCLLWNQNSYEVIVFWSDFFCDCNVSTSTTHNISKCNFEALWEILLLNISWKFYLVAFGTQSNFSFYTVVLMRKVNFPEIFHEEK